ncbi:MAG: hypothetical protein AAGD25_37245 [Cyanobacteria bacterium P01_F01_bin.150]
MTFTIDKLTTEITIGEGTDEKNITLEAKDLNLKASLEAFKARLQNEGWTYSMDEGEKHFATLFDIAKVIDKYNPIVGLPSILDHVVAKTDEEKNSSETRALKLDKVASTEKIDPDSRNNKILKDIKLTITDLALTVSTSKPSFKFGMEVDLDKDFYTQMATVDGTVNTEVEKIFNLLKVDKIGVVFSYKKESEASTEEPEPVKSTPGKAKKKESKN